MRSHPIRNCQMDDPPRESHLVDHLLVGCAQLGESRFEVSVRSDESIVERGHVLFYAREHCNIIAPRKIAKSRASSTGK